MTAQIARCVFTTTPLRHQRKAEEEPAMSPRPPDLTSLIDRRKRRLCAVLCTPPVLAVSVGQPESRAVTSPLCFPAAVLTQTVQEECRAQRWRTDSGSYPMFTLVTGIVGRWRAVCVTALQRPNSDAAAIRIVVGIAAASLSVTHRCVAIFKDKQNKPTGFALGSIEGRVAIHYINPPNPAKDNFTFKCHRSNGTNTAAPQDIYAVNGIAFHPVHGTLATVGSDGRFSFWDKDARTKLKTSEQLDQPISACCFNHNGNIFAYSSSYDWSKGHEFYNPQKKNYIFLRNAAEELKPRNKK
ncbi:unnamed protein product [Ranitomeya imitator]|uniref:mRNA export factor n=1 Tax=Ranitomeya imitator TaxID=111125 RepID=A0ABN9MPY9_9NEOB|nr:unnamed protein product [Ranitomeya imitator]